MLKKKLKGKIIILTIYILCSCSMINTFTNTLCLKWSRRKQAIFWPNTNKLTYQSYKNTNTKYQLQTVTTITLCTTVPFLTINKLDDNFTVYDVILQVIPFKQPTSRNAAEFELRPNKAWSLI